ncbi:hypothetical protein CRUP_020866 [Coryphaenoides rupestris]|nr:hypothetical protein CRUP_020866 [Coryphaenoides rupestris]
MKMIPDKAPKEEEVKEEEVEEVKEQEVKEEEVFHAPESLREEAHVPSMARYKELYRKSIENPDDFFWKTEHTGAFMEHNFDVTRGEIFIKCMAGASTNVCYNLLDHNVHHHKLGSKVAFYWEGNEPGDERSITYAQLLLEVCRFANVLKAQGVRKGDRVSVYMPMVLELVVAMLACARIGAVHSVVDGVRPPGDDIYWCTADIGWITGHSYITYGPLANGATSVLFEGLPTYPDVGRMWAVVDRYRVTKFYTAPTAIRLLMKYGKEPVQKSSRASLRILGSVGEPINREAWLWYYSVVGEARCPIVDTFWQTETGGHVLTPLPAATPMKPGSATFPFFGVVPAILNESGEEVDGVGEGYLVFKQPWPGVMRSLYGDHRRFESTYFNKFPGYYVTGDGCRRDKDGYYWITGRIDDMLNVSGHLLSTAEVESSLAEHPAVAEAAVVGCPHPIKGESLYCFVTLHEGAQYGPSLEAELRKQGKIMRRVLRQIARNERDLGDISTLADASVVEQLFENRCGAAV